MCILALTACGRPDAAQTTGVQATAVPIEVTAQPLPTAEASPDAAKIARLAQLDSEQATAVAANAVMTPVARGSLELLENPPTPLANKPGLGLGLTTDCREFLYQYIKATNCWTNIVGDSYVTVYADALRGAPEQGVVVLDTSALDYSTASVLQYYYTAEKVGSIRISSVTATQVLLTTETGAPLAFDIATRQWVDAAVK